MRALAIAATGMSAQEQNLEVIANNIANINTTGFKRSRAEFTYLIYQNERLMGVSSSGRDATVPEGAQIVLESSGDRAVLAIRAGRSRFTLQTLPESDFPDLAAGEMTHKFALKASDLKRLIDAPLPAAPVIVDVGCGKGISFRLLADAFGPRRIVGIDYHEPSLALAAEEAVLSLAPGETLGSLALRYLQPVRVGPAVASATLSAGLARVEVRDSGREDRLAVMASARLLSA